MKGEKTAKKTPSLAEKPLSIKEQLFADHYILTGNGRLSAINAGYAESSAGVQADRILKRLPVKTYIDARTTKIYEKLEVTQEKVILEMARIALFNPKKLYDSNGNLIPIRDLDNDTAAALASFEIEEIFTGTGNAKKVTSTIKKVKMWNKPQALESFFRHFNLYKGDDGGLKLNLVIKKGGKNANS